MPEIATLPRSLLLWCLFFATCLGLGYPTLNRYDPRKMLPDSASYCKLATDGPGQVEGYFRFRVLEPYLVRPIYHLAEDRVGSWDPLIFGFLVVNAFFVAGIAYMTFAIGGRLFGESPVALVAAMLYLLNFAVANAQLAALVDAGEAFFLMALILAMYLERWWILPLLGILGALTKESFVPFSLVMAAAWWMLSKPRHGAAATWIAVMAAAQFTAITMLQSSILGHLVWPWSFAAGLDSHSSHFMNFLISLIDKDSWFILIWLLPLGLLRVRQFPRAWLGAAATAGATALLLNAYHTKPGAEGGTGRYIFNVAGPLLCLSAARFLCEPRRDQSPHSSV